jgi:uncharacterized protein
MSRDSKFLTFSLEQDEKNPKKLIGTPIVYNQLSKINEDRMGKWATRIKPFAFSESLKSADIKVFYNHDKGKIVARRKNDTLKIKESEEGVQVEVVFPSEKMTTLQSDVYEEVSQGLTSQMSFGVRVTGDKWFTETFDGVEVDVREIQAGEVFEVSVVSEPAFETTSIAAFNSDQEREKLILEKEAEQAAEAARIADVNTLYGQRLKVLELGLRFGE